MATMLIPMAFMVFYIAAVGVCTFFVRKDAVTSRKVSIKYFSVYDARDGTPPEFMLRISRHFDNLMQAPILFLVTSGVYLFYGLNSWWALALGWSYVMSRMIHTYIHLGSNHLLKRAGSYFLGWIIILTMWAALVIHHLNSSEAV